MLRQQGFVRALGSLRMLTVLSLLLALLASFTQADTVQAAGTRNVNVTLTCPDTVVNVGITCTVSVADTSPNPKVSPTGTITFSIASGGAGTFSPTTCNLAGAGATTTCSVTFTPTGTTGTRNIRANYPGDTQHKVGFDTNNSTANKRNASTSVNCPATVVDTQTTCTITVTDNSGGTKITPTGTVTIATLGNGTASPSCVLSAVSLGIASCTINYTPTATPPAFYLFNADYPGDTFHNNDIFTLYSVTVAKRLTTTAVACTPNPAGLNVPVTCTATVTDSSPATTSTPTGTVSWTRAPATGTFGSISCTLAAVSTGVSRCSVTFTQGTVGAPTITGTYIGAGKHNGSSGSTVLTISLRSSGTSVVCTPGTINYQGTTSCVITVSDTDTNPKTTPTGTVALSVSGGTGTFGGACTLAAGTCTVTYTATGVGTGTHTITANYGGDTAHATSSGTATVTVNKVTVTVTATDQTRVYGAADPAFTATYSGFVGGDTVASLGGTLSCVTSTTVTSPVGSYPGAITCSDLTSANYTITYVAGTMTITKANLTITADDKTRAYGAADPVFTATYSGLVAGDTSASLTGTLACTTTTTVTSAVGTYPGAITCSGQTSGNYNITYVAGKMTITQVALTITADNQSRIYGMSNPAFTVTYAGFVAGDTAASLGGALSCSTTATITSSPGTYPITCSGQTSPNYVITYAPGTLTITKATATVTLSNLNHIYDGTGKAATATTNPIGLTVVLTYNGSATLPINAGSYAVLATISDTNYQGSTTGTLIIAKADQTITFAVLPDKVYGDIPFNITATASSGLTVTFAAAGNCTIAGNTVTITGAGSCTITASQPGDNNYNAAPDVARTFTISKTTLTVKADDATKAYGAALPAFSATYTGFVNGDTAAALGGTLNFSTTATASSPVGTYPITPSGVTSANYTITFVDGTLSITQTPLTVTTNNVSKIYGSPNPAFTVTYGGFVAGDTAASLGGTLGFTTAATAVSPVGAYPVTPAGLTSPNYNITFVDGTLTITQATLTVKTNDATKIYGTPNPIFTATITGYVNGDTAAVLGGTLVFTTAATTTSPAGTYPVTPSGLTATNYIITFVDGTLTIGQATLTVTANNATKIYGAANPAFTVTYTGFVNGDTSASLGGTLVFTTAATTSSPVGTYPVTPSGLTSLNYTIVFVNGTLTVNKATLIVNANNLSKLYGAALPALTVTYGGFVNGDTAASLGGTLSCSTTATASSPVATYPISCNGQTSSNYTIVYLGGTLTINKAALTVTANNLSKVYGVALPTFTVTYAGFVLGETPAVLGGTLSCSTTATAASPVGAYPISCNGQTSLNYIITYVNGTLTITKVPLTITANNASKIYGAVNPAFSVTYAGFVNGDTPASLGGTLAFTTPATAASPVATYPITPSGLTSPNYTITFVNGTLTVGKAPLTVKAADKTKVYGSPNPAFTVTYTGFLNGDTAASLGGTLTYNTLAGTNSPVGLYSISPLGLTSANYNITFVDGTLSITKAPLTVTANNASKVYGSANPAFSVSYSPFVLGQDASVLTGPLTFTTPATASSLVGTYAITPGGLTSPNYAITFVDGTLTITKASLGVKADDKTKVYNTPNPALTVTYTGFVLGQTASVLGGTLNCTTTALMNSNIGTYPISCNGQTSLNYNIFYTDGILTIVPAPDTIPPTTVATLSTPANVNGWHKANVVITFAATDNPAGNYLSSGVKEIVYSSSGAQVISSTTIAGNTTTLTISGEGVTTIAFFARDNAGNAEAPQTLLIRLDKTAPALTTATPARGPDNNGWYTAPVVFTFAATDTNSGVDVCTPTTYSGPVTATATVTGSCTDKAGNVGQRSFGGFKYDDAGPNTTSTVVGVPVSPNTYQSAVTVKLFANDGTDSAGVKEIVYSTGGAQTIAIRTVGANFTQFVINQVGTTTITYFSRDNAGNAGPTKTLTITILGTITAFSSASMPQAI